VLYRDRMLVCVRTRAAPRRSTIRRRLEGIADADLAVQVEPRDRGPSG